MTTRLIRSSSFFSLRKVDCKAEVCLSGWFNVTPVLTRLVRWTLEGGGMCVDAIVTPLTTPPTPIKADC